MHVLCRMSEESVAMRGEAQPAGLVLDAGVTEEPGETRQARRAPLAA